MAADTFTVTERLWLTADGTKLVADGDADAAFLYSTPGKQIPMADAVKYGLVKKAAPPADKAKAAPANKTKAKA